MITSELLWGEKRCKPVCFTPIKLRVERGGRRGARHEPEPSTGHSASPWLPADQPTPSMTDREGGSHQSVLIIYSRHSTLKRSSQASNLPGSICSNNLCTQQMILKTNICNLKQKKNSPKVALSGAGENELIVAFCNRQVRGLMETRMSRFWSVISVI